MDKESETFTIKIIHPDGMKTLHSCFSLASAFVVYREELLKYKKCGDRQILLYNEVYARDDS